MKHVVQVVRSDGFSGVERYLCEVAPRLQEKGLRVTVIGGDQDRMRSRLGSVAYRPAVTTLDCLRALRSMGSADVVHSHMTAADVASVAATFTRRGTFRVSTRHFAAPRGSKFGTRLLLEGVTRGLHLEVSISEFVAANIGVRSVVVHNGVARRALGGADLAAKTVLVMQRLESEKDTSTAVRAWADSRLAEKGWRMIVAGRGSERAQLQALSETLGVASSIDWPGFVDDPAALQSAASIFMATALAEPFGLSLLEAMAAGLPVVATESGAHPEVLGSNGRFFAMGDSAAAADALVTVASDVELHRRLSAAGRARQARLFEVDAHVDALLKLYAARG